MGHCRKKEHVHLGDVWSEPPAHAELESQRIDSIPWEVHSDDEGGAREFGVAPVAPPSAKAKAKGKGKAKARGKSQASVKASAKARPKASFC